MLIAAGCMLVAKGCITVAEGCIGIPNAYIAIAATSMVVPAGRSVISASYNVIFIVDPLSSTRDQPIIRASNDAPSRKRLTVGTAVSPASTR